MEEPAFEIGPKANIRVGPSPIHGIGVFAVEPIAPNHVVEICPTIAVPPEEEADLRRTILGEYVYPGLNDEGLFVVLGFGSLYNHSVDANARYVTMPGPFGRGVHVVSAISPIEAGEEITVNYTGVTGERAPLWFDDVGSGGPSS